MGLYLSSIGPIYYNVIHWLDFGVSMPKAAINHAVKVISAGDDGQPPIWSPGSIGTFVPDGRAVATGAIA
jgi:hypothetical protein